MAELDSRIIVIHKTNGGLSDARNVGIDAATGDYICFIDSDDWIESHTIQYAVEAIRDVDMVVWGYYVDTVDKNDIEISSYEHTTEALLTKENEYLLIIGDGDDREECKKIVDHNMILHGFTDNPYAIGLAYYDAEVDVWYDDVFKSLKLTALKILSTSLLLYFLTDGSTENASCDTLNSESITAISVLLPSSSEL